MVNIQTDSLRMIKKRSIFQGSAFCFLIRLSLLRMSLLAEFEQNERSESD